MKNEHRHEAVGKRGAAPHSGSLEVTLNHPLPSLLLLTRPLAREMEGSDLVGI